MMDKLDLVMPEIAMFIATCVVMVLGLSPSREVRRGCALFAAMGLFAAGAMRTMGADAAGGLFPELVPFAKGLIAIVGLLLLLLMAGTVDREEDKLAASMPERFDPLKANRAEFYAFFMFSLTGLMLVSSADDLIWLFLALELTSLPTYIMVTISTRGTRSQEAGVKYFFLGALGAAIFLYGFALLYGATGSTDLAEIAATIQAQAASEEGLNPIASAGLVMSFIGLCFKIAAVPMHFYAADVYQGAHSGVSAFLAFVPKAAGILAIMMIAGTAGWTHGQTGDALPDALYGVMWTVAALTMFVGNVLALLQTSIKRMLAYSSIAHSGYMLVGIIAGPGSIAEFGADPTATFAENGLAAALFYLLCYGVMNAGAFAVVSCLERNGKDGPTGEIDEIDDLRGLHRAHPHLAFAMVLCGLSLLGLPPLLGFFGKLGLFTSAIAANEIALVVVLGLNSAIAAFYYLRIVVAAYLDPADEARTADLTVVPFPTRVIAAFASAGGVVLLAVLSQSLVSASLGAATYEAPSRTDVNLADKAGVEPVQATSAEDDLSDG
ncbi:MAG: NADH-quinone oxidoreductase subunit N [Planctomycetota bacterium]